MKTIEGMLMEMLAFQRKRREDLAEALVRAELMEELLETELARVGHPRIQPGGEF